MITYRDRPNKLTGWGIAVFVDNKLTGWIEEHVDGGKIRYRYAVNGVSIKSGNKYGETFDTIAKVQASIEGGDS